MKSGADLVARRSPSVWLRESLRLLVEPGDFGRVPERRRELTAGEVVAAGTEEAGAEEVDSPPSTSRLIGIAGVGAYSYTAPVFCSMYHSKTLLRNCTHF